MDGAFLFLADTLFRLEHLLLVLNYLAARLGGLKAEGAFLIAAGVACVLCRGTLNYFADEKLRRAGREVNSRLVEKYVSGRRHKHFTLIEQGSIQRGDVLKI